MCLYFSTVLRSSILNVFVKTFSLNNFKFKMNRLSPFDWNQEEKQEHINFLELTAVFLGLKIFAKDCKGSQILLRIDNTTAISYINKMGSVQFPKLSTLSKKIWQWCESRKIWLFASYIKSSENIEADSESRIKSEETEWELSKHAFQYINKVFGPFDIDLFASRLNAKCKNFVSWFPDPEAIACDAFTISWKSKFYAFPPFSLILKVLQKIREDKVTGVLVVPWWPTQPWFPIFMELKISEIIYFKPKSNLLKSPFRDQHPLWKSLTLAAAILSGAPSNAEEILKIPLKL